MFVVIKELYCVYPWECVAGVACVCIVTSGNSESPAGESQCIHYVYITTPGAHTVHTHVHIVLGCRYS